MTNKETKLFWNKLLGFPIGKRVTFTYRVPLNRDNIKVGTANIQIVGKVIEMTERTVIIQTDPKVTCHLKLKDIVEAHLETEEEKKKLRLFWGGMLGSWIDAQKEANSKGWKLGKI